MVPLVSRVHASLNNYPPCSTRLKTSSQIISSNFLLTQLDIGARMRFLFRITLCLCNAYSVFDFMENLELICCYIKDSVNYELIASIISEALSFYFYLTAIS
jgi:hypothetical protein